MVIFYYSGTGNSLWLARTLAGELGTAEVVSMPDWEKKGLAVDTRVTGLVFPVHIWGVPRRVLNFLDRLADLKPEYIFAIANNAGQVANTLVQLDRALQARGLSLSGGWSVVMPSNYIPWGGPGTAAEQEARFAAARQKLSRIAEVIKSGVEGVVEKGPLWQRVLLSGVVYNLSFSRVPGMDSQFWADGRCNKCGLCVRLCPSRNIVLQEGNLSWQNHCEQCMACIQWCPQEALQYGKKTPAFPRYHHPEIGLDAFSGDNGTGGQGNLVPEGHV